MWKTVAYYCASCCCITVVCVTADWLVFRFDAFQKYPLLRAVTDNLTHGLVGCWCWATSAIFLGWGKYTVHECLLCFAVACAVDADHFIEARSLSFKVSVESTILAIILEAIVTSTIDTRSSIYAPMFMQHHQVFRCSEQLSHSHSLLQ